MKDLPIKSSVIVLGIITFAIVVIPRLAYV